MEACWECSTVGEVHHHHPVPKSRGGTRTIPLCLLCHGKAHGRDGGMATSRLTREGMEKARSRGVVLGKRPYGETAEERAMITVAVDLRSSGLTLEQVSAELAARGMLSRRGLPLSVSTLSGMFQRATPPKSTSKQRQPTPPVVVGPLFSWQAIRAGAVDSSRSRPAD